MAGTTWIFDTDHKDKNLLPQNTNIDSIKAIISDRDEISTFLSDFESEINEESTLSVKDR